jgi:hypothetical protein
METETNYREILNTARVTGVWDRAAFNALFMTNPRAVEKALTTLFALQTQAEQSTETTRELNGVGFSGLDAEIFSSFAKRVLSGKPLTPGQIAVCRKQGKNGICRLARYWQQLRAAVEAKKEQQIAA